MAGRGPALGANPARKSPGKRARRNSSDPNIRVIEAEPQPQPPLPDGVDWHPQTLEWWAMWGRSPLAGEFTANDWSELLDTAQLHSRFWHGDVKMAAELRLRVAKFGATPEDRARLRITFAQADEADQKRAPKTKARSDYGDLKVVGGDA